jgi:hypothetical protein
MATLTINFQANAIGNHIIAYKTYNEPFPVVPLEHVIIVENVVTPGPQSVDIAVEGNLYCGEITYDGYVVASCLLNDEATLLGTGIPDVSDDAGANGVPDVATTFSVLMEKQADPCTFATITCDNTPITSITIDDNGTSVCDDGTYPLVFTEVTAGDELIAADIDVIVTGNVVTSFTINNAGSYKVAPIVSVTIPNCTSAPAFTAVMEACPIFNLSDVNIQCLNDDGNAVPPLYELELGESVDYCVAIGTAGTALGTQFAVVGTDYCHCRECENYSVQNTDTVAHIITFQTCWDEAPNQVVTTTQLIPGSSPVINLGCGVKGTVVKSSPFLTVTTAVCA